MILDLVEFCHRFVSKPIQKSYHQFFQHHHLIFDPEEGKEEFRDRINTIFSRNGLVYELNREGKVIRLSPTVLREALSNTIFRTGDSTLDKMLQEARLKFMSPNKDIRREALERLWDCWERIKTLEIPGNKKLSIGILLDKAAVEVEVRQLLEEEAKKLTDIGNSFHIRHSEVTQTRISDSDQIDYLFHRLFALIQLFLKKR